MTHYRKNPLHRPHKKVCRWCNTPFTPNGPNGGWLYCSKSCNDRAKANAALPREPDDEAARVEPSLFDKVETRGAQAVRR